MSADICIIAEATYPYVTGGVSTCVHQIIEQSPQLSFSVLYLGASVNLPKSLKYQLPTNVTAVDHIWLFDHHPAEKMRATGLSPVELETLSQFIEMFSDTDRVGLNIDPSYLADYEAVLFGKSGRLHKSLLRASASQIFWDFALASYQKTKSNLPFLKYVYQWRSRMLPLLRIFSSDIPRAKMYYSITTGHAGVAGIAAKLQHGKPLMITEHGIYPRERRHDLWELNWMRMSGKDDYDRNALLQTREDWLRYFDRLSLMAYHYSDIITTLFGKYVDIQVSLGADRTKCYSIANGMNTRLLGVRVNQPPWTGFQDGRPFRVSFIGRITPIKDLKCLISAIAIARHDEPNIVCHVYGPWDDDPAYFDSCKTLVNHSGQQDHILFMGKVKVEDILPKTDLLVLTSLSEGQPMVILEAAFAGIPVVATDVGGCNELVNGESQRDVELGPGGLITRFAAPDETAAAILRIARSPKLWKSFSEAGMSRAKQFYDERRTIGEYNDLFKSALDM
jgi:glycosyltransferase involved in cell wall biosynthesis